MYIKVCILQLDKKYIEIVFHIAYFLQFSIAWYNFKTLNIVSIEELKSCRIGEVFIGDMIVIYNTYLDKAYRTHKVSCAEMTDANGIMTITLTFLAHHIEIHEKNIVPKAGISIKKFKILPKSGYDHGDCNRVISIVESSVIERVSPTCKEHNFIPATTIKQFASNTNMYPIDTIGVFMTLARKVGLQYNLQVKDGNIEDDKAKI
jgi:hypothetical protein